MKSMKRIYKLYKYLKFSSNLTGAKNVMKPILGRHVESRQISK